MKFTPWIAFVWCLGLAGASFATDVELRVGIRSFEPDDESWPEVGGVVYLGPDRWQWRPVVGASVAVEPVYGGTIVEGDAGVAVEWPITERVELNGGLGFAALDYDFGVNQGEGDARYVEIGLRWVRLEGPDFGVVVRRLDGPDIELRTVSDPWSGDDATFRLPISTVAASFSIRW